VAVRVALDDRLDSHAGPDVPADGAEVGDDRVEVDLQPGRSGQRRQAGVAEAGLDRSPRGGGAGQRRVPGSPGASLGPAA
jgi:hypothetical protein